MTSQTEKQHVDAEIKQNKWGPRFKAAREAMHLTEKDAAARLHLKPHIISIIESERFQSGPPAIFMRGYLKSYAKLLNFSEKEVEQILLQLSVSHPEIINTSRTFRTQRLATQNNNNYSGWMTGIVVLVLLGLVGMWWNNHAKNIDIANRSDVPPAQITADAATIQNTLQNVPAEPTPREMVTSSAAPPAPPIQTPSNNVSPSNNPVETYTKPNSTTLPAAEDNIPGTTVVPNDTNPAAQSERGTQIQQPVPGAQLPAPPQATTSVPSNQALPTAPQNSPVGVTPGIQIQQNTNSAPTTNMHPVPPPDTKVTPQSSRPNHGKIYSDDDRDYDAPQDFANAEMAVPEQGLDDN